MQIVYNMDIMDLYGLVIVLITTGLCNLTKFFKFIKAIHILDGRPVTLHISSIRVTVWLVHKAHANLFGCLVIFLSSCTKSSNLFFHH